MGTATSMKTKQMNTIIIYASKYGSTRQYAEWLGHETGYDAINIKDIDPKTISGYERIIVGSSVHMGRLDISSWLKKHWNLMADKSVILFSVNGTPPDQREELQKILDFSLPTHILDRVNYFPLQGRLIYAELNFWHKLLVKMMKKMDKHPGSNLVLEDYDNVRKENLVNLKNHIVSPAGMN